MSFRHHSFVAKTPQSETMQKFQAWANEKNAFLKSAEAADKERSKLEKAIVSLRAEQRKVSDEIHATQDALGSVNRVRDMLLKERARLEKVLAEELAELEECAKETNEFCTEEAQNKEDFCNLMDKMNQELGDILIQQEDFRLQQMISIESASLILQHFEHRPSPDSKNADNEDEVMTELKSAFLELDDWTGHFYATMSERETLSMILGDCRAKVMEMKKGDGDDSKVRNRPV